MGQMDALEQTVLRVWFGLDSLCYGSVCSYREYNNTNLGQLGFS